MFTGLVEEVGVLTAVAPESTGARVVVGASKVLQDAALGDSIAVNGVCLTVTELLGAAFSAHAGSETLARTTVGDWKPGLRVNLERALSASSRMGGHFVQGHVDGVGRVQSVQAEGETTRWRFALPAELSAFVVEKGSIAVDGISLTVAGLGDEWFEVAVIPHTLAGTTLGSLQPGSGVNLETDILAKYVYRMMGALAQKGGRVTEEFLREHGFA